MPDDLRTRLDRLGLLIGGMKCGSTTLFATLAQHPQVAPSHPKEPHFFSFPRVWAKGMDWYEGRFLFRPHHRVALDGSPSYGRVHAWPDAPRRIARLDADVRVTYLLRDPVARVRSHVRHALYAPWGQPVLESDGVPTGALQGSDYAATLDAYEDAVGRDAIHVLTLGDLRRRPDATLTAVQRHLGVDGQRLQVSRKNTATPVPWQARPAWHTAHARLRSATGRRALRAAAHHARRVPGLRRALFVPRDDLPLPDGWEEEAREALAPSMDRLRERWGVDVGRWGF